MLRRGFATLVILFIVVLIGTGVYLVFQSVTGDSTEPLGEPITAPSTASAVQESDQLVSRVVAFETAYATRLPGDTPEDVLARMLEAQVPKEYVESVTLSLKLDMNSNAGQSLHKTGDSMEVRIVPEDVSVEYSDSGTVAYATALYEVVRKDKDGTVLATDSVEHATTWLYDEEAIGAGWQVKF